MGLELTDRVAVVTGAAQGIGEATARTLAERGAIVVGLDAQGELLGRVMAGIPRGVVMAIDVTDAEADRRAIDEIHRRFDRIDILVNVAGGTLDVPAGVADWARRTEAQKAEVLGTIAIQRLGEPFEVANVIAFVASGESSYLVGQTITVDGGHWMF